MGRPDSARSVGRAAVIAFFYGPWLVASGEDLRAFPLFCPRIRLFPDVPEAGAVTDLFLPLR